MSRDGETKTETSTGNGNNSMDANSDNITSKTPLLVVPSSIPSRVWKNTVTSFSELNNYVEETIIQTEDAGDFSDYISLHSIRLDCGRTVSYSITGEEQGSPVLFWYAGGCNRRILVLLSEAAEQCQLRLICLNRPERGDTSPVDYDRQRILEREADDEKQDIRFLSDDRDESTSAAGEDRLYDTNNLLSSSNTRIYMETCLSDAIAVLDALNIARVGLFYECAGCPFAMSFVQTYPERMTTAPVLGIGSWVQPVDCNETNVLFKFSAQTCPSWLIAPFFSGGSLGSLEKSSNWTPAKWVGQKFVKSLTKKERAVFEANFEMEEFVGRFRWMQKEGIGMPAPDLTVLLSNGGELGIDYSRIQHRFVLLHALEDRLSPYAAAEWLANKLRKCEIIEISNATHEGTLFLLHHEIEQAMKLLVRSERGIIAEAMRESK